MSKLHSNVYLHQNSHVVKPAITMIRFRIILVCQIFMFTGYLSYSQTGHIRTFTSEDWDYWELTIGGQSGRIRTFTGKNWEYNLDGQSGSIKTFTSKNWDHWEVNSGKISLRTFVSDDWDHWEITGSGINLRARTFTSEDWDYWEISGDASVTIRTFTSQDWDHWEITGDLSNVDPLAKVAILFIPIFISSIYIQGRIN